MITRKHFLLALFLLAAVAAHPQRKEGRPNVDEMHQQKWEFIVKQTSLTPDNERVVKPVFIEHEKSVWEIHRQVHNIFRHSRQKKLTEKEYKALNDSLINFQIKETQLIRSYHLKLSKMLEPETLFNYYLAEKKFKMQLLQKRPPRPPKDVE